MKPQTTVTDLGIIRVESGEFRDTVYLAHNDLQVFTLRCRKGRASALVLNPQFYTYDEHQWKNVFETYVRWKRQHFENFKLPHYSGRTKDGHPHPWRRKPVIKKPPTERDHANDEYRTQK